MPGLRRACLRDNGRLALVNREGDRYPGGVNELTIGALRDMARERGLDLTEAELQGLLPLVQAGRALMAATATLPLRDVEPASQYRIF